MIWIIDLREVMCVIYADLDVFVPVSDLAQTESRIPAQIDISFEKSVRR